MPSQPAARKDLPDGSIAEVWPMTYGKGRITVGDGVINVTRAWCYDSVLAAVAALHVWDGDPGTEPEGWFRNPYTGELRPENTRQNLGEPSPVA